LLGKKYTRHETGSASIRVRKFCHGIRSASAHIRKKILRIWICGLTRPQSSHLCLSPLYGGCFASFYNRNHWSCPTI